MSLELLQKKIKTTQDLFEIVRTMKTLSSVSILQYEQANKALDKYRRNLKDGFHALIITKGLPNFKISANKPLNQLNILIGSDNSLVGKFNKEIVESCKYDFLKSSKNINKRFYMTIGKKLSSMLSKEPFDVVAKYPISNSVKAVNALTETIIFKMDDLTQKEHINQVVVYFHKYSRLSRVTLEKKVILPLDRRILADLWHRPWETNNIPMVPLSREVMFSSLLKETLMITLASLLNYSLAAEHYTRMTNMQNAEKNIKEKLVTLNLQYQLQRQEEITDELTDVISGAEAMRL